MLIGVRELSRNLSQMIDLAVGGEEIVVTRHGKPIAKLVPYEEDSKDAVIARLEHEGVIRPPKRFDRGPRPDPVKVAPGTIELILDDDE